MTHDRVIEKFALMPSDEWRRLALQASWHYRTGGERSMPPKILAALGGKILPREEWNALCKQVSAKKRALKYEERKYLLDQRRQRRRAYMRQYMKGWRANQKARA